MNPLLLSVHAFVFFALVLARVGSVVSLVPFVGGTAVPRMVKVFLTAAISLVLLPSVYVVGAALPTDLVGLTTAAVREIAIGVVIGFPVGLVFISLQLAGQITGQVMGLGLANVINPFTESRMSIVGQFYFMFGILVFLGLRGHHILFEGLAGTYGSIPVGGAVFHPGIVDLMVALFSNSFLLAIKVAAPAMAALFVVMLSLGFIARTVPQLNILVVGFPISIMIGLVLVALSLGAISWLLETHTASLYGVINEAIRLLSPGPVPGL